MEAKSYGMDSLILGCRQRAFSLVIVFLACLDQSNAVKPSYLVVKECWRY